jgi:threonine/homoserine/homoserine lactone efflux protein
MYSWRVLVAASEAAYIVLRVVGAAVLIALGVRSWVAAWRDSGDAEGAPGQRGGSRRGAFAEGLLVQLGNPKAAVFMFAFYPQFVPEDGPLLVYTALLALLQISVETGLYLGLAAAVGRAAGWFRRPRIRRRLEAISGTVLVALGARVAASSR